MSKCAVNMVAGCFAALALIVYPARAEALPVELSVDVSVTAPFEAVFGRLVRFGLRGDLTTEAERRRFEESVRIEKVDSGRVMKKGTID